MFVIFKEFFTRCNRVNFNFRLYKFFTMMYKVITIILHIFPMIKRDVSNSKIRFQKSPREFSSIYTKIR